MTERQKSGTAFVRKLPRFIAVEGPIGVGKTSLARRLAETFNYDILLEKPEENPFLERFYENPRQGALATQLFFLFQRARQIQNLRQDDLFEPVRVADFLIDKDQLFARQNLDQDEYALYQQVYDAYTSFFHYYNKSALLIVNSAVIDLVDNQDDYQQLVDHILTVPRGTHYFNPKPSLL